MEGCPEARKPWLQHGTAEIESGRVSGPRLPRPRPQAGAGSDGLSKAPPSSQDESASVFATTGSEVGWTRARPCLTGRGGAHQPAAGARARPGLAHGGTTLAVERDPVCARHTHPGLQRYSLRRAARSDLRPLAGTRPTPTASDALACAPLLYALASTSAQNPGEFQLPTARLGKAPAASGPGLQRQRAPGRRLS